MKTHRCGHPANEANTYVSHRTNGRIERRCRFCITLKRKTFVVYKRLVTAGGAAHG